MKKISKVISLTLALILMMSLSLTAFAAEITPYAVENNGSLTVTGRQLKDKNVTIVRMFTTDIQNGVDGSFLYGYALEEPWQAFFDTQLAKEAESHATAQEAYEYVTKLSHTQLIAFVKAAETYYQVHTAELAGVKETVAASAVVPADPKNPMAGEAEFTGLTSGYYLVIPEYDKTIAGATRGTHTMLVNVSNDKPVHMVLKTDDPKVDKDIVDGENAKPVSSAQIGDDVKFQLTATVPNMTDFDAYTFKFKDTMSKGLTLKEETIKVTVGTTALTKDDDYTVVVTKNGEPDNTTVLVIDFKDLKSLAAKKSFKAGDTVKVEYSATVNKDAQIGSNANTNKAELEFSNDPSNSGTGHSTPSVTKTYTFEIKIHKYANEDKDQQLAGAEFKLLNAGGNLIKLVTVSKSEYRVATQEEIAATTKIVDHIVTVSGKDVVINGLKEGEYKLVETNAPEGYNKLTKPIEFKIVAKYNLDGSLQGNYPQVWLKNKDGVYVAPESGTGIFMDYTQIMIQNKSGAYLPETGSIGTIGLTIAGVALVVGGIGFTSRKKREQA